MQHRIAAGQARRLTLHYDDTPMQAHLEQLGAELIGYGPADAAVPLAEGFGAFEAEYAAIRRHVGILHLPQTGVVKLTGR